MSAVSGAPLERTITDAIMRYLKGLAPLGWFRKIHGGNFQTAGIPDIIGCYRGVFVAFEVKRPAVGRLTPLQAREIELIASAGGVACVVRSVEDVRREIVLIDGEEGS